MLRKLEKITSQIVDYNKKIKDILWVMEASELEKVNERIEIKLKKYIICIADLEGERTKILKELLNDK